MGIKSILWILAILRGVYGVMGPTKHVQEENVLLSAGQITYSFLNISYHLVENYDLICQNSNSLNQDSS